MMVYEPLASWPLIYINLEKLQHYQISFQITKYPIMILFYISELCVNKGVITFIKISSNAERFSCRLKSIEASIDSSGT